MKFTIDELTTLIFQHSRRATQTRNAAAELLKLADEDDKVVQVYLEAAKRLKREKEEQESRMILHKIISGVSMLVLMLCLLSVSSVTQAQDVTATAEPSAEATAVPNPGAPPATVDNGTDNTTLILSAIKELALIAALVVLAFKAAGLVPADVLDKALARGFDLARGWADTTTTPIDNRLLEIAQPILTKLIADELAKRDAQAKVINESSATIIPRPGDILSISSVPQDPLPPFPQPPEVGG